MQAQDWSAIESACLGGGLPPAAEEQIRLAGQSYHQAEAAEQHLRLAEELAPNHLAVMIGFYRYYFYKSRLEEALTVAQRCLAQAGRALGLDPDWQDVSPGDADFGRYEAVLPRFYLFTLKGCGYLNLRLGRLDQGRRAVQKLRELDPSDRLGGSVLDGVLQRMGRDDDDE